LSSIRKIGKKESLNLQVYQIIKNYVIRPDTPPGTRLYEERLTEEIGVSRTPVKIALNRLEQEGLVIIKPNKGAHKIYLTWRDVCEIVKIRAALEGLSIEMLKDINIADQIEGLAGLVPDITWTENAENKAKFFELDQKFHNELMKIGKSQWVFKMINNQAGIFDMLRMIIFQDPTRVEMSINQHRRILDALKRNDISQAIAFTKGNYESSLKNLENMKNIIPGLFL